MDIRIPAFAGQFYPGSEKKLNGYFEKVSKQESGRIMFAFSRNRILGGVVPHAGYLYSGRHAVHFFGILARSSRPFETVVILNPNHTGHGPEIALDTHDAWETPLGMVLLDKEMMELLPFSRSSMAHDHEHSGEVMVPFLQYFIKSEFRIIPVTIGKPSAENAKAIAGALMDASVKLGRKIIVIASSDFSHFLSPDEGCRMDEMVLKEVLALNTEGVAKQVYKHDISVCGFGPIMALMEYSMLAGSDTKVKILSRGHSGEVFPSPTVVDYITLLFYQESS